MGDTKQGIHCAEADSYTVQDELAREYETFLLPKLPLGSISEEFQFEKDSPRNILSALTQVNSKLNELIGLVRLPHDAPELLDNG